MVLWWEYEALFLVTGTSVAVQSNPWNHVLVHTIIKKTPAILLSLIIRIIVLPLESRSPDMSRPASQPPPSAGAHLRRNSSGVLNPMVERETTGRILGGDNTSGEQSPAFNDAQRVCLFNMRSVK